ncbi:MAG: ABC transporter permease [Acidobacteria bacterium]|nr:ABC transporter permease [Acidobacteriota bacterium]
MSLFDLLLHALENLWRSRLRSSLTVMGVVIGVGFLVTMVSLGAGLEEWANEDFISQNLFATLNVRPKIVEEEDERGRIARSVNHLTEEAYDRISALPGIEMLYPELRFPVRVRLGSSETTTFLLAIPLEVGQHPPLDKMAYGTFPSPGDGPGVVVSQALLRDLDVRVVDGGALDDAEAGNGDDELLPVAASELLGHELEIVSTTFNRARMIRSLATSENVRAEFEDNILRLPIVGIRPELNFFWGNAIGRGDAIVSLDLGKQLPTLGFSTLMELYDRGETEQGYSSVFVRGSSPEAAEDLRLSIEEMGYEVQSFADDLEEAKNFLWIFDSIMALLGGAGLLVATLGIANTMLTSMLERTREIGILVAIGASERDVRRIYFVEAMTIGLMGGTLGLAGAWLATHLGNYLLYEFVVPAGVEFVAIFRMPPWLAGAAVAFAIVISWIGGAYPAYRAARIDPVRALRRD